MSESEAIRRTQIAQLNDELRIDPLSGTSGRVMMTRGVGALGSEFMLKALDALAGLKPHDFETGNDPYRERDFAVFEVDGERLYAKIDYYEKGSDYLAGAETPEDASKTDRVLTLMLAEEY